MSLTDYEKQGLFDFFKSQDDRTILMQLAKSLTKNYMPAGTLEEALNIVFLHGGTSATILNKKILTKEIMFKYLHKNSVRISTEFTKISLVEQIQNFWKEKFSDSFNECLPQRIEGSQCYENTNKTEECTIECLEENQQNAVNIQNNTSTNSTYYPINLLSKQFSEWFFNSYNESKLRSDDFWIDSTLHLKMVDTNSGNIQEHRHETSDQITELLLEIKRNYNLICNPNLSREGVQGRLDIHGLVLVLCCGTLHNLDRCIGTFESLFGLIRDPNSENNWKIKNMKLILKSSTVIQQVPCLSNSDSLSEILNLPEPSGDI